MKENYINFYPTPRDLLERICSDVDWSMVGTVLEPEAGKGDICDFITERIKADYYRRHDKCDIDCIEINGELRKTLVGKEYRVVHDDFLTYSTRKHYDLIIMNPPFDQGDKHLLKALELQEHGGDIICILNAETIRNPYSVDRKALVRKLELLGADIQFMGEMFSSAERTTMVEIAVIKVHIEDKENTSFFFEELRKAKEQKVTCEEDMTDIAVNDYIKSAVQQFEIEVDAGLRLIREYRAMCPYVLQALKKDTPYNKPILELKLEGGKDLNENAFVKKVRFKYWSALFNDERFTAGMPSNMRSSYSEKVRELSDYDFSYYNIKEIQIQMLHGLVDGIEGSILELFHKLSDKHSWYPECQNNIHYYNGWATNKAYFVNKKVILPEHAWSDIWKKFRYGYDVVNTMRDIEKALDYLDGVPGRDSSLAGRLQLAENRQETKNIECRYFFLTFYKKGTVHITFKDENLIKRLNIFAGKHLNMLPPCYGKKAYKEMTPEEKAVVDSFDGSEEAYEYIRSNPELFEMELTTDKVLMLAG